MTVSRPVGRRSVRAVLFDDEDRLVLIRRTKPGRPVYWTTAGGGVEPDDPSRESALHRELLEELGARTVPPDQLATIDLKPVELRTFPTDNVDALLSEAAPLGGG